MRTCWKYMLLAAVMPFFAACGGGGRNSGLPSSHSAAYEIIVTANHNIWTGAVGDTLRAVMQEAVPMLNSYEPQFDMLRIQPQQYSDYIRRHRNTIVLRVDPQYEQPQMRVEYDKYAAPQLIVYLVGPDQPTLAQYMHEHAHEMRTIFNMAERDRWIALAKRSPAVPLQDLVKTKFGFEMPVLVGTRLGNDLPDFLWLRYEYPQSSQGIVIYSYPYSGEEDFTLERLLDRRDEFAGRIPGEVDGSHMVTYREIVPELTYLRIKERPWAEVRGFWDVEGDFMGGPFVSYSTLDTQTNRVVTLDFYVYSPSPYKPKRNLLRQLESMVYSVQFPGDKQAGAEENQ